MSHAYGVIDQLRHDQATGIYGLTPILWTKTIIIQQDSFVIRQIHQASCAGQKVGYIDPSNGNFLQVDGIRSTFTGFITRLRNPIHPPQARKFFLPESQSLTLFPQAAEKSIHFYNYPRQCIVIDTQLYCTFTHYNKKKSESPQQ